MNGNFLIFHSVKDSRFLLIDGNYSKSVFVEKSMNQNKFIRQ